MQWLCPVFLLSIFVLWVAFNVFGWNGDLTAPRFDPSGYITDLIGGDGKEPSAVARLSVAVVIVTIAFLTIVTHLAGKRWSDRIIGDARREGGAS